MSQDVPEDVTFNPFAEEHDYSPGSTLTQGFYSSAFFPKRSNTRPTLRLRRSPSTDQHYESDNEDRKSHRRTLTDHQTPPMSAGLHPLKSALARINNPVFPDLDITTRPYLSRIMSEANLNEETSAESSTDTPGPLPPEEEKDVIVHHVTSKDSLAGVSLKYGISLANLRKANQLWTTDTIHLRDTLYIPIDQASRAREYILQPPPTTSNFHGETTDTLEATATSPGSPARETAEHIPPSPSVAIRRIPTRQLSYFPPSAYRSVDPRLDDHAAISVSSLHPAEVSRLPLGHNRYSSSPASNSLTSILTALPIAASTRDEIITRLSLDSVSSSFTDRSGATSQEDGHELDEVKRPKHLDLYDDADIEDSDELILPTPKAFHRLAPRQPSSQNGPSGVTSSSRTRPSHSSMSPPRFYVSQANETNVRTSQLEPSPAMQLPSFRSATVGRALGKRLQVTGTMERTGSLRLPRRTANAHAGSYSDVTLENLKGSGPV